MALNSKSILFHGTSTYHKQINLGRGRPFTDFGRGYYLTSSFPQAAKWAVGRGNNPWVFQYDISDVTDELLLLPLLTCDTDWINVILYYRTGYPLPDKAEWAIIDKYDIIFDQMADGRITKLVEQFLAEEISKEALMQQAQGRLGQDQYCFKTPNALKLLHRTAEHRYDPANKLWIRRDA